MDRKDTDLYLLAKRQVEIGKVVVVFCIAVLLIGIALRAFGISNIYLDFIMAGLVIGGIVTADGGSFRNRVSKAALLEIIERQINTDPEAIRYVSGND